MDPIYPGMIFENRSKACLQADGNRNDFEAGPLEFSTVFKLILCVNRGEDLALFNVQKMVGTNRWYTVARTSFETELINSETRVPAVLRANNPRPRNKTSTERDLSHYPATSREIFRINRARNRLNYKIIHVGTFPPGFAAANWPVIKFCFLVFRAHHGMYKFDSFLCVILFFPYWIVWQARYSFEKIQWRTFVKRNRESAIHWLIFLICIILFFVGPPLRFISKRKTNTKEWIIS